MLPSRTAPPFPHQIPPRHRLFALSLCLDRPCNTALAVSFTAGDNSTPPDATGNPFYTLDGNNQTGNVPTGQTLEADSVNRPQAVHLNSGTDLSLDISGTLRLMGSTSGRSALWAQADGTSTNPNTVRIRSTGLLDLQSTGDDSAAVFIEGAHTRLNLDMGGRIRSTHNHAVEFGSRTNNVTITVAGTITTEGRRVGAVSGRSAIRSTNFGAINNATIHIMSGGLLETNTCLRADTAACPANASTSRGYGISIAGENANITLGTSGTGISFDETTASNNARILTQGPDSHGIRLFADGNAATTNIGRITTYADSLISTTGAGAHGILIDNTIGATNTAPVALDLGGRIEVTGANAVGLQLSDANLALADVDGDTTNGGEIRITGGISTDGIAAAIRDSSNTSIRLLLNGAAITGDIDLGAGADRLLFNTGSSITGMVTGGAGNDMFALSAAVTGGLTGGVGNDTLILNTGGSIAGNVDLGAGSDTLSYGNRSAAVSVALNGSDADGFAGDATDTGGFSGVNALTAGSATDDALTGYDADATWTLGANTYEAEGQRLTFRNFENLTGGAGVDTLAGRDADATWTLDGGMDETYTTGSGQNAETLRFRNIENLTGGAMTAST